jgi:serine phosphatase RsbU (regulator of sigma subunit)
VARARVVARLGAAIPEHLVDRRRKDDGELRRLYYELAALRRDIGDLDDREHWQETLVVRLRREAAMRDEQLAVLHERLEAAEDELEDLRAIRDALTPPELPQRPGLELAAAFLPAAAERVSGDFYLVAEGPRDSTVLVVGDASETTSRRNALGTVRIRT